MPRREASFKNPATPPDSRRLRFFRKTLLTWGRKNFAPFPWRFTRNSFHALLAEMMLQRTRAEQVVPVFDKFVKRYPSASSAAREHRSTIKRLLIPLGLIWRGQNIRISISILAKAGDTIPSDITELRELPGVGEYAAAAYTIFHLRKRARLIDANIVRLYGRFFGFKTDPETRRKSWFRAFADSVQPRNELPDFGYALLDFTRSICAPRPRCDICPLRLRCSYAEIHESPGRPAN